MAPYMYHFKFLQTISVLYVLVTVVLHTGSSVSHDEECAALFHFKQSMIHQDDAACVAHSSQVLHSWNTSFDCCSWEGVACNNDHMYGHVIGIDLSDNSLCGNINSNNTLFSLVHLQRLNLSMNYFSESQIPSKIARLKQLRSLDLSYCGFSGQIPNEISQLLHLSSLDLSWNSLKLHNPSLKYLVQNLTGLEELHLSGVDIRSSVPHFLVNFSSLRSIELRECLLWNEFPTAILELPKLQVLDLAYNTNLSGCLPEFRNNSLLEKVILYSTSFFGIVPRSLSNLNHLTVLSLYQCDFSGRIPGSLSNMTQLTYLGLGENQFKGLVPSLVSLLNLDYLVLNGNEFEKGHFPNWLGKLNKLSNLFLSDMNITDEIPPFLANLTKLSVVDIATNSLSGRLPSWLFNLTQLTQLDLSHNQFEGQIRNEFSNFKSLVYLNLGRNNFSGRVELDMFLGLNKLQKLCLSNNKISVVPATNYTNTTLPELDVLLLSSCNLKEFPAFLRFQNKLILLGLGRNKIDGPVPPSICKLKSLQMLSLPYNNLSGTLPSCLGILTKSLMALDLKGNNFHGTMMNDFMSGSLLKYLDLSENRFTGQLSRSLTNCTNLEVLSLGDNSFHDVFPSWLETLVNLQVLVLRSNKLYGPVQGSVTVSSQFPKLRIIDLSNNCFSGQLHQNYFQTWNAMTSDNLGASSVMETYITSKNDFMRMPYAMTLTHKGVRTEYPQLLTIDMFLDLSCNKFEGEIPLSLQDLRGLQALNLSNNHFTGRVFPSLGNLKNLEAMDLSQNELYGEIPQQLVQLGFLSIFNVSFNHLDGHIPKGKQFDTFENDSYMGNPKLCGPPLAKECQGSKVSRLPPTSNVSESLLPSERIDWIIIFCGVGSGLVVGIGIGNFLHTKYSDRFTKRKHKWVRPLRNTRRN